MAIRYCWSGSGVTARANSTAYSTGARIVIALTDTAGNFAVARRYVWECTTAGTSGAAVPTWPASVTADTTTLTDGTVTWTARNPGYSSGTTENWTFATIYFLYAVAAANASGDLIYVQYTHSETLTANTTYTFVADASVISVNKDSSNAPTVQDTNGYIGSTTTTSYTITIGGAYKVYFYGITFRAGATTTAVSLNFATATPSDYVFESCYFYWAVNGGGNVVAITLGRDGTDTGNIVWTNCKLRFGATNSRLQIGGARITIENLSFDTAGSRPTTLFNNGWGSGAANVTVLCLACDLSFITGTLVADNTISARQYHFVQCKLGSGVTPLATQTQATRGSGSVFLFDSSSGDTHTFMGYYDAFGSCVSDSTIYYTTGAAGQSWKIVTTANCSFYTPFVSPFVDWYNTGTSAVTPYIEILRDGSTTAFQNDEVWGEFFVKTTSGSTQSTEYSDRMALLGTPANQAAGAGTGSWTGEAASAWSGKVDSGSAVTPAEAGAIRGRVVVGEPSITVYVDPQIRT